MEISRRQAVGVVLASGLTAHEPPRMSSANPRLFTFIGGSLGTWSIVSIKAVIGDSLPVAEKLDVVHGLQANDNAKWILRGATSNTRYTNAEEKQLLVAKQADIGRSEATRAALIPIRKNSAWWNLSQDDRRKIFEESSHHIKTGLKYLPDVTRRLHHCRDLAESEPFDFLTYFDYAPKNAQAFEELVAALRATEEWKYVDREVDIRLVR